jgi:hypothetical protein
MYPPKPREPCTTCGKPSTYWSSFSFRRRMRDPSNPHGSQHAYCAEHSPFKHRISDVSRKTERGRFRKIERDSRPIVGAS